MTQYTQKSFSVFPKSFKRDNSPICPKRFMEKCINLSKKCKSCELVQGKPTNYKEQGGNNE